jgi:DNA-binding winged helix-turn-helix (wHTH) protein/TolB-like protein
MLPSRRRYEFGRFLLDAGQKVLFLDGRPVPLTPKATETLVALVERHGTLVTKDDLLRIVWPNAFVEENNLAQNISLLRRVLGEGSGGAPFIETVPRRGYRFVGKVAESGSEPAERQTGRALTPASARGQAGVDTGASGRMAAPPAAATRRTATWTVWAVAAALSAVLAATVASRPWERPTDAAGHDTDRPPTTRVAVLPFINLGAPADESFVAGMTEEITSRLARLSRMSVLSSTSARAYDRRGKRMPQIAAELGVEYVIEGAIRWTEASGQTRVRISSNLIRAADDTTVWTEQYETRLADLFDVQSDLAYQITGAMQVALDARERRLVDARPTEDMEAYTAYLRGISTYGQGASDTANLSQARLELEQAVRRDPRFALAWSWLARTYSSLYRTATVRTPEVRHEAYRAARTAIDLDPALPDGHVGLAQMLFTDGRYDEARHELSIAGAGLPSSPEILQLVAWLDQREGRWSESRANYERAFAIDPASTADLIAVHYLHLRQFPEARRYIGIARAANRSGALTPEAWTHFSETGDIAGARVLLESALESRTPADARAKGLLARLEWFDGRHERALEIIETMDEAGAWMAPNFRFPAAVLAGQVYQSMGRQEDAARSYAAAMADLRERQRLTPDDFQVEAAMALAAIGLDRIPDAIRHAERAVELLPVSKDATQGPLYLYLLAQIQARAGHLDAAFATLETMFSRPCYYNEHWLQREPAFASLRRHPAFPAAIARWSLQKGDVLLRASADR